MQKNRKASQGERDATGQKSKTGPNAGRGTMTVSTRAKKARAGEAGPKRSVKGLAAKPKAVPKQQIANRPGRILSVEDASLVQKTRKVSAKRIAAKSPTTKTRGESQRKGTVAGGSAGFRGYEYQVDVSVWAALDLVLAKGMTTAIEVEPASQEDVEAWLSGVELQKQDPTDPGRMSVQAQVGDRALVVQAKFTARGEWSHTALTRLLEHGGPNRLSAKDRLRTSNLEYVLMTSGPLTGVARSLSVREFTQKLEPASMPKSLAKNLPTGAAGRVKVIESHDEDRIVSRVRELLVEAMKIPLVYRDACLADLRDVARHKMTGRTSRTWTREELSEVIARHGGCLATSPDLAQYIRPENWSQLCDKLDREHAVIIFGRSGTGKTMTAAALWDHVHETGGGHRRVVADRPSVVRETELTSPVVFDIEDPWGKYQFEPKQDKWLDRLPNLLRLASPNRKFIITTREDVMIDARMREDLNRWRVQLQPDDYSRSQRRQMYDDRIPSAPRELQISLARSRDRILNELSTPNEIDRFFANLRDSETDNSADKQITAALERARYDFIELTIAQQIRARQEHLWAVIVWALLGARKKLTRQVFVDTQALLAELDDSFDVGLDRFLNFFIAGRTLRQSGQIVSYYHPRSEAAFAAIAAEEKIQSTKLLAKLIDALTQVDLAGGWGTETAAFVLSFVARSETLVVRPSAQAQAKIDDWICRELSASQGEEFREAMRVAAAVGSNQCRPAEFARFVLEGEAVELFNGGNRPERPTPNPEWFDQMRTDLSLRALCRKWVETALPNASEHYTKRLVGRLLLIEPDIAKSFIHAMATAIRQGVINNSEVIAAGAVLDLESVEPMLKGALDDLDGPSGWDETWQKIRDGLYSEGYAQHLAESAGEEGYSAGELVDQYVAALRRTQGWQAIARHPLASRLGRAWARLLPNEGEGQSQADVEEVRRLVELGIASNFEDRAWDVVAQAWDSSLADLLVKRAVEPIEAEAVRRSIAVCIARSATVFPDLVRETVRSGNILRLILLFEDLKYAWRSKREESELRAVLAAWARDLPPVLQGGATALLACGDEERPPFPTNVLAQIAEVQPVTQAELHLKIKILMDSSFDIQSDIQRLLEESCDNELLSFAIRAAARGEMTTLVEQALSSPRGIVRGEALRYLAAQCDGVLPQKLLVLHEDESRYVREAIAEALAADPRPEYVSALERLVADDWSDAEIGFGYDDSRPIARIAAAALAEVAVVNEDSANRLFKLASSTQDSKHRSLLLQVMVRRGSSGIHKKMLAHALRTENSRLSTAIAQALLAGADVLDVDMLGRLDPEQLVRKEPEVAAQLIVLLGVLGPEISIDKAVGRLLTHRHRKVLLVLLARVCQDELPATAAHIRIQMAASEAVSKYLAEAVPLPLGALDALGDALTVQVVERWLAAIDKSGRTEP